MGGKHLPARRLLMPSPLPARGEVRQAFHQELHPAQQRALISWLAFTTTFATVRAITYSIKDGKGPLHNLTPGGLHLHHYLWGILTLTGVGGVALHGQDRMRRHPTVATAYGVGLALIVDEFALLLDLKDVYWDRQGRVSVDVAVSLISAGGSVFAARPILRRLRRNRKGLPPVPNDV
jgi:hypothetical protein